MKNKIPQVLEITQEGWEKANKELSGLVFFRKPENGRMFIKIASNKYWNDIYSSFLNLNFIISTYNNENEIISN